jgi:hypothetical protein
LFFIPHPHYGSTQYSNSGHHDLGELVIAIPSLNEQLRIVETLNGIANTTMRNETLEKELKDLA